MQIRHLERSLGTPLLHRSRSGVQLTDTGRTVFDYSRRIFALAHEMQQVVEDIQGLRGGRLTIGSSTTPGEYILPWAIGVFQKRYPDIEVSLSIANHPDDRRAHPLSRAGPRYGRRSRDDGGSRIL